MELVTHAKKIASMSTKSAKGVALLCFDAVLCVFGIFFALVDHRSRVRTSRGH